MTGYTDWTSALLAGDTSHQAALSIAPHVERLERLVLEHLAIFGPRTCDAVEAALELSHQTLSPRFTALRQKGLIVQCDRERTRSGRYAWTYRVAK